MYAIGLDIGTTSICGVLMNTEKGTIELAKNKSNSSFIPSDKPWEKIQDTRIILNTVYEILSDIYESDILKSNKVCAIGISGQMHGILYTDKNGNAVSNLYIWQDERGNQIYKDGITYAQELKSFAGYGLVTDFYNRQNGLVPKEAAYCCSIGDYVAMKLCKQVKPIMHISNAASFGCFDIFNNKFVTDNGIMPEVSTEFSCVGEYNGAIVSVAVGDNQASFIGSVSGNMPLINVGTGSQVSYLSDSAVTGKNIESRPFDGNNFLVVGSSLCGGRAFSLLERFFASVVEMATGEKCSNLYPQIDKMLADFKTTDMEADSRFCGTRSEPWRRASFRNISQENFSAENMAIATLNAIADELYSMYKGPRCEEIVCSGNGIRKNPALQKIISETFEAKIKIPHYTEEASFGAALTALTCYGEYGNIYEATKIIKYR